MAVEAVAGLLDRKNLQAGTVPQWETEPYQKLNEEKRWVYEDKIY